MFGTIFVNDVIERNAKRVDYLSGRKVDWPVSVVIVISVLDFRTMTDANTRVFFIADTNPFTSMTEIHNFDQLRPILMSNEVGVKKKKSKRFFHVGSTRKEMWERVNDLLPVVLSLFERGIMSPRDRDLSMRICRSS